MPRAGLCLARITAAVFAAVVDEELELEPESLLLLDELSEPHAARATAATSIVATASNRRMERVRVMGHLVVVVRARPGSK
jgi:hypothetical protein